MNATPEFDVAMMRRAIALAMEGRGITEPNPSVGCVLVKEGRVIGEGRTQHYGGAHAEPTALANCTEPPAGATAYVTLEPCCHTNKKTPPCVPAVIGAGIKRVVVGCLDPNPEVNGKGVRQLQAAGVEVTGPILETEARQLIAAFIARTTFQRPYVTLKWAESSNGKMAGPGNIRRQISNPVSTRVMHGLRGRSDAIMVGLRTLLSDDPLLTARNPEARRQPVRVVLDTHLQSPATSQLATTAKQTPVLIYTSSRAIGEQSSNAQRLEGLGVQIVPVATERERLSMTAIFHDLHHRGVSHLMIEPGQRLLHVMMDNRLWDRAWVFRSPEPIEANHYGEAPAAPKLAFPAIGELELAGDRLTEYLNPGSSVFFSGVESADFVLARQQAQNGSD